LELVDFFDLGVLLGPERPCIVRGETSWSYGEMQHDSMRIASALRRSGCATGTHFAVLMADDPGSFRCALGGLRAHLVWLPITLSGDADRDAAILDHFDCDFLFYESQFGPIAKSLRERRPSVLDMICIDGPDDAGRDLGSWLGGAPGTFEIEPAGWNDIAAILPTGGTTGMPKGAVHSHLDFQLRIASHLAMMPVQGRPRYLLRKPALTNSMAIQTWQMFMRGGTGYMVERDDVDIIADTIERHRITDVALPVTVLYMLLADSQARAHDFSSVQHLVYATAPMSATKLRDALAVFGPVVAQVYSQTETLAHIGCFSAADHVAAAESANDQRLLSCGRPGSMIRVAIMDLDGRLLGPGEVGEIVVRGASVMKEYYKNPAATAEVSRFGWHHTGDAGYFDGEGFFYIVDRLVDLIPSEDGPISPSAIERAILEHDAVRDCVVVGSPGDGGAEQIVAVAELKAGATATSAELIELCLERLGPAMTPVTLEIWPELPRSARGKVLKRAIREHFAPL
jgi:fatty-acyl-CoA synthase